jgi:hypothetical protein
MISNVGSLAAHFAIEQVSPLNMSYADVAPSTAPGVDALFASMDRKIGFEKNL